MDKALLSARRDFEERTLAVGAATVGRSINVAGRVQRDFGAWNLAVAGPSAEVMQHGVGGRLMHDAETGNGATPLRDSGRKLPRCRQGSFQIGAGCGRCGSRCQGDDGERRAEQRATEQCVTNMHWDPLSWFSANAGAAF